MDGGLIEVRPTDWAGVCADLAGAGWTVTSIASFLNLPRTTVQRWARGAVPNADAGYALMRLHARVLMGKPVKARWQI